MAQDSQLLLTMLPDGVWTQVLDKCAQKHRYDDIESVINSSPFFRNLLKYKSTSLLFPRVFKVIGALIDDKRNQLFAEPSKNKKRVKSSYEVACDRMDGLTLDPDPEETRRHLIRKPESNICEYSCLLKMRSICKRWKYAVDSYFQTLDYHYRLNHDHVPVSAIDYCGRTDKHFFNGEEWTREIFSCWYFKDPLKFIAHYDNTHSFVDHSENPFIGKSITITEATHYGDDFPSEPITEEGYIFWNGITNMLEKYGEHIWYCELSVNDKFSTRLEYYRRIKEWLDLMPNLKVLEIFYECYLADSDHPTQRDLEEVEREVENFPVKGFKQLSYLKTSYLPAPIFNELVRRNWETINSLDIRQQYNQCDGYEFPGEMPTLKKMCMQVWEMDEVKHLWESAANWNLDTFYFLYDGYANFKVWSGVFKLFEEEWTKKITNLMINLPNARTKKGKKILKNYLISANLKLDLPNVKRFKFNRIIEMPIDFMLSMKNSLEIFEVNFCDEIYDSENDEDGDDGEGKNIKENWQIKINEKDFYERTNIWEWFPRLEKVHVWFDFNDELPENHRDVDGIYTREIWEQIAKETE